MHLTVQHLPAPGREPWCIVLQSGTSEVRQERHPTREAAIAALPEVRKALRMANPARRIDIQEAA